VDGGEHAVALAQQPVEHQQRERRLGRVGVDDDVAEGAQVLRGGGARTHRGSEMNPPQGTGTHDDQLTILRPPPPHGGALIL